MESEQQQPPPGYYHPQQQQPYDPSQAQAYDAHHQYYYYPQGYYAYPPPPLQPDPTPAATTYDSGRIPSTPHYTGAAAGAVPEGLNPAAAAAAAALSQLTQFAGAMDAAERAMAGVNAGGATMTPHSRQYLHHPQMQHGPFSIQLGGGGRSPYRGGGRRGGGPFRGGGGGRGNFAHQPLQQDGGGAPPPSRGRGRGRMGRGGGRQLSQPGPETHQPYSVPASTAGPSSSTGPVQARGQAPLPMLETVPFIEGLHHLLPRAWCDICRVDCNSLEILEQHKNGKRHKKTMQRFEEIQAKQKLFAELQAKVLTKPELVPHGGRPNKANQVVEVKGASGQMSEAIKLSAAESTQATAFSAQVGEAIEASGATENIPTTFSITEENMKPEVQSQAVEGQSELQKVETATEALETETPSSETLPAEVSLMEGSTSRVDGDDRFDRRRGRGPKRKTMSFGRGGKRQRSFEPVQRRLPQRPREQPRVCTLCNVMCDTLAIFESHLSGKKHISKIKRFQGQDTDFGPIIVYIPPNQPSAYPTKGPEPVFYGLKSHEMLQQEAYSLNGVQVQGFAIQQDGHGEQTRDAGGEALSSEARESVNHPESEVKPTEGQETETLNVESRNALGDFDAEEPRQLLIDLAPETATLGTEDALPVAEDVV